MALTLALMPGRGVLESNPKSDDKSAPVARLYTYAGYKNAKVLCMSMDIVDKCIIPATLGRIHGGSKWLQFSKGCTKLPRPFRKARVDLRPIANRNTKERGRPYHGDDAGSNRNEKWVRFRKQMSRRGQRPRVQGIPPVGKPVLSTCDDVNEIAATFLVRQ
jgi:hypothetical protein